MRVIIIDFQGEVAVFPTQIFGRSSQREKFFLAQMRYDRILSGAIKSNGRRKEDLIRDNVLLKAKIYF